MTTTTFEDITIGETFFDPYSGDVYQKLSNDTATMYDTNGDYLDNVDTFELNEIVEKIV